MENRDFLTKNGMKKYLDNPKYWSLLAGVVFCLSYHGFPDFPQWGQYVFFVFFVVVLGIPHGALDHLVEEKYVNRTNKDFSFRGFLLRYLFQMLAYAVLWYFFPAISLLVFLGFSAWHFGESDLNPAPSHWLWSLSQWLLGGSVLVFILLREPALTGDLMHRITQENETVQSAWAWIARNQWPVLGGLAGIFVAAAGGAQLVKPRKFEMEKAAALFLFMAVLYFMPLLPAFALYFGGWHSVNTFQHIEGFLGGIKKSGAPKANLWLAALPLTGVALVFLVFLGWIWQRIFSGTDPLPILFIFIAIITLPHLQVMGRMLAYGRDEPRPSA